MSPKTLVGVSGVAAILFLMAACSSQMLTATPSTSPETAGVAPSAPLPEPYPAVLARWNYYRASVGIPPIVVEPELNQAALHHAKYLVNNHIAAGDGTISNGRLVETGWNLSAHSESEGNQWYTEDGAKWADYTNVFRGTAVPTDGAALVDAQAAGLDSIVVFDPQLAAAGFGIYCANDDCAGVIVYKHGLTKSQFLALYEGNAMDWNALLGTMPFTSARLRKPIEFPPGTIQFPSRAYRGNEYPDALSSCPGYKAPTGVPIILELGAPTEGENVKLTSNSVSENGTQLETCGFDAN